MPKKKLRDMTIYEVFERCIEIDCYSCEFFDAKTGCLFGFPPGWLDFLNCEVEEADYRDGTSDISDREEENNDDRQDT